MILHLVRHGQSVWNLERRLQGQTLHVPLTDEGLTQARRVAAELAGRRITTIWSSDQVRARQTADEIAAVAGIPVQESVALREQGLGSLEGVSYDDLHEQPVPEGQHISEVRWGGGESVADVHARLIEFVAQLPDAGSDDEVVVVSHGDTLRILLAVLAGRGHREVEWLEFGNGEHRTVEVAR
ncbi:MAG: histidine phosphatase family protein [Propionibacteriaceae bacterium]|nr:histidine phosphatase family protein [Propionibacteriaceae bacterium]